MSRTRAFRRGRFESLEPRQLLAGDVLVNVIHGHLMVQGDELDNKLVITAGAEPGSYLITGLDGTTVHLEDQPAGTEVTVAGVHSARVRMGAGNDLVGVVGANFRGHVAIDTGVGDDRVLIGSGADAPEMSGLLPADLSVAVRHSLVINTGSDNDQVAIDDASIGQGLAIHAGIGDDTASLGGTAAFGESEARLHVRGGVHVNLGAGNDGLTMDQLRVRRGIVVHGGVGDDTINATKTSSHAMAVLSDGGIDSISLTGMHVGHLGIHTGEDNDSVDVRDSVFASFNVSLGDGDDTLTTSALKARVAVLLGGDGEDTLNTLSENTFAHKVIRGFEIPPDVNVNESMRRPLARRPGRLR